MARKKKDNNEQDIQVIEKVIEQEQDKKENNKEQNKENIIPDIVIRDTRTLEQKLNSYKRRIRRI